MKKFLLIAVLGLLTGSLEAALISRPYSYSSGNTIDPAENNANENTLYTEINGNLNSANIAANGIATSNIADSAVTPAKIDTSAAITFTSATVTNFTLVQGTITTSLSMNNRQIVNVSSGTGVRDVATYGQVPTFTDWATYTPAFTGLGTVSNTTGQWRRVGDTIEVRGKTTAGTRAGAAISVTLPNSYTIDTTKLPSNIIVGIGFGGSAGLTFGAGDTGGVMFYDGSDASVMFAGRTMGTSITKVNGNALLGADSTNFTFFFSFPASGLSSH